MSYTGFVFVFVSCLKSLKLPNDLTKLSNFVNKDYDFDCLLFSKYIITFLAI